ncbi:MAG TPA: response regulator [Pyrinomonadaceae bacterium]|nr:response regulator [Pyrinomonadaceae bacterium]
MNLVSDKLRLLETPNLTTDERTLLRCQVAADLIYAGQYEAAKDALGDLWHEIGNRPDLKGRSILTTAEILLQCGVLSGWLGSVRNISQAQEQAKNLLSEALRLFEAQGCRSKVSEVQYELGICYWRVGAYDEARIILREALQELGENNIELEAKILIRRTLVEISTNRDHEAWEILEEAKSSFETCSDAVKGRWHGQKGLVLFKLATIENRADYFDRAIIEYTAAIYHYERAKHERYCGNNLNNLAFLLYKLNRFKEAHENLDRAYKIFARLKDPGNVAQVNETRARALVAEGRFEEAARVVERVVRVLEQGGENGLLADALAVQGVALARLGQQEGSMRALRRAVSVATDSGAHSNAGQAALTLIEEHAERMADAELYSVYRRADRMLKETQDAEDVARLRACARVVVRRMRGAKLSDEDFSLPRVVREYEARFIEQALDLEEGSVTRAAKRLGVKHQTLAHLLETRHRHLLQKRRPAVSRRRSIITGPRVITPYKNVKVARPVSILLVEDNEMVAEPVRDCLEYEGWRVETCADGGEALRLIEGPEHFDLLLLDNELPGVTGLELIRRARSLAHRRRTPIAMFSGCDVAVEARSAGADAFLRKPDDMPVLVNVIGGLLAEEAADED